MLISPFSSCGTKTAVKFSVMITPPEQVALASSSWVQTCLRKPLCRQAWRCRSVPWQRTSFSQMGPVPSPNQAPWGAETASPQSSSRHTTATSSMSQSSSQTVPHFPRWKTSTRPMQRLGPPVRRTEKGPADKERLPGYRGICLLSPSLRRMYLLWRLICQYENCSTFIPVHLHFQIF